MLSGISIILVLFATSAQCIISISDSDRRLIISNHLTDICACRDVNKFYCPLMAGSCRESRIRNLCLVTCNECDECDDDDDPTLEPTVKPCEFNCVDLWPPAICEYYNFKNFCPFVNGYCRKTCEDCTSCVVPPTTPIPCDPACADSSPISSCQFWRRRDFCDDDTEYPSVRFLCQRTCGVCRLCS